MMAGLVWGRELYFDATQVQADAALDSLSARFAVEARAPLQAHLAALFPEEMSLQVPLAPPTQEYSVDMCSPALPPSPTPLPVMLSDGMWEDLAATNAARHDWIAKEGQQQREVRGVYQRTADLRISTTDPDATPMRLKGGGTHLGYQTHYVVDGGKARIIVGVLVTPSEVSESQPMLDLLWRARFRWKLRPPRTFRTYTSEAEQRIQYRAQGSSCRACPLKAACTPSVKMGRSVLRSFGEEYLERVQSYHATAAYQKALRKRKVWVEPLFAEAKEWHGSRRFRLRRMWRVNTEALMIAAGQNFMRLLAHGGWGHRPLPSGAALAMMHPGTATRALVIWVSV